MQIRHIGLLLLLLLLAVFSAANWRTIAEPTDLNLLVVRVQAPFGLLMIGTVAVMGCVYGVLLLMGERRLLQENARLTRELAAAGGLGSDAEQVKRIVAAEIAPLRALLDRTLDQVADIRTAVERPAVEHSTVER